MNLTYLPEVFILYKFQNYKYHFLIEDYYYSIIQLFKRFFFKVLNVNQDSALLLFFVGHRQSGTLVNIDYQFFIERLNELNAEEYTVFNSC